VSFQPKPVFPWRTFVFMSTTTNNDRAYHTITQVADLLGVPVHVAGYAVQSRKIAPADRIGNIRLFGPEQIEAIKAAIEETAKRGEVIPSDAV